MDPKHLKDIYDHHVYRVKSSKKNESEFCETYRDTNTHGKQLVNPSQQHNIKSVTYRRRQRGASLFNGCKGVNSVNLTRFPAKQH